MKFLPLLPTFSSGKPVEEASSFCPSSSSSSSSFSPSSSAKPPGKAVSPLLPARPSKVANSSSSTSFSGKPPGKAVSAPFSPSSAVEPSSEAGLSKTYSSPESPGKHPHFHHSAFR